MPDCAANNRAGAGSEARADEASLLARRYRRGTSAITKPSKSIPTIIFRSMFLDLLK